MHSQLNLIVAQSHQYDLREAARRSDAAASRRRFVSRLRPAGTRRRGTLPVTARPVAAQR